MEGQKKEWKIFFLCDGEKDGCTKEMCFKNGGMCHHTSDVRSAANFRKGIARGQYYEKHHGERENPSIQVDCCIDGLLLSELP